jgi:CheY-like chemotaxis protein
MSTLVAEIQPVLSSRFRILVVDDEPAIRELAGTVLKSLGYDVRTATDGLDALRALCAYLPDLIISDLNMPRMSGFEFLALVRERFPHIATIAMSGGSIATDKATGPVADAFLQKGQNGFAALLRQVVHLMSSSGAA